MEKNKVMLLIIIILLVALIATIGAVSFMGYKMITSSRQTPSPTPKTLSVKQITYIKLDSPINTNLLVGADNKEHALRVSVEIGVDNTDKKNSQASIDNVTANLSVIREICISIIRASTAQDMKRTDSMALLKADILSKVQERFQDPLIYEIVLSDIYVQ